MAGVRALLARVRLPIFSIKHPEAFQVMSCLPVPQPSSLVGALAYSVGTVHGFGSPWYERLTRGGERGERLAARSRLIDVVVHSSIVLRRFRVADEFRKRTQLYEILDRGDVVGVKLFLEVKLIDAFYRGYAVGHEILCAWILGEGMELDERAARLLQRLGDTESLVSVPEAWVEDTSIETASNLKTSFPFPSRGARIKRGDFMMTKMCDERRRAEWFIIPIRHEVRHMGSGRAIILEPTEIEVDFPQPVQFCETSVGTIVM